MQELRLELTNKPDDMPVSIDRARQHLRVDETSEDQLIADMIDAATRVAQNFTRRQFITATYKLYLDYFPTEIELPRPPLQSVESIQYYDTDGTLQTLDSSVYTVDNKSTVGKVVEAYGQSWPSTRDMVNAVVVEFVAGYGDKEEDVPGHIRQAIRLIVGHMFEHREDVLVGVQGYKLPAGAETLLWFDRIL